jgi:integrase
MKGSVRKKGTTWYYRFAIKENDKWKSIERKGGKTKKEAEFALRNTINEYEGKGSYQDVSDISLADYMDFWLKQYVEQQLKYNTQQSYKGYVKNHIKPYFKNYKLKAITPELLINFFDEKKLTLAQNTLHDIYGVLNKAFRMAVYPYKYLKDNPMAYVTMPKYNFIKNTDITDEIISPEDYAKILQRFPETSHFYLPLQIGYYTGMRIGEVLGLTWECIDFDKRTINIYRTMLCKQGYKQTTICWETPKTEGSIRTITFGDTLYSILKKAQTTQKKNMIAYGPYYTYYVDHADLTVTVTNDKNLATIDYVCRKENGQVLTQNTMKYLSRVINKELGIKYHFHALRHTHATLLLEAGANIKAVQKRLGHSRLATTMDVYSHVTENLEKTTVDIFEKNFSQK